MESLKRAPNGLAALTALIILIFIGMPFIKLLGHERPWSTWMLLAITLASVMRLFRTLRNRNELVDDRLVAARDATTVVAALVGCIAVATQMRWATGAAVVATEFVLLIEFFRHRRVDATSK